MRFIYFCLVGLLLSVIFSCSNSKERDYVAYHHKIIDANFNIINGELDSALAIYEDLFKEYPKHFYKDVHNGCVCAIKLGKFEKALQYAKELVLHGYQEVDFQNDYFTDLRASDSWIQFGKDYSKLRDSYLKNQDKKERNIYHELFLKDQKAADIWGICNRDSLYKVYFKNANRLHTLYSEYGLPKFLLNKDSLNLQYWAFFRHYFGMKNIVTNSDKIRASSIKMNFSSLAWDKILLKELHHGNLTPEFYSQVVSYHNPNHPYGKFAIRLDFQTERVELFTPLNKDKASWVNKNRDSIGLMPYTPLNSDVLKTTWYANYPFKEIKQAYLNCGTCKTDDDYFELMIKIEKETELKYAKDDILNGFLLDDYRGLKERWLENIHKYKLNLPKNASCSKPK
ncbi:tetratricopeptide repeat protein [Ancylomarina longa]|uniref:Tetratricopeptide repeat protein n=1 Tax=Ancylomarina longa TaxID=2487017 RepID=A0A434AWT1_9BACT|nr:tetratricopeptide repeat protein [Ancylomarina longa]RUT78848.1 tetratricopeptide repeat protein [Ancylomarina longa]